MSKVAVLLSAYNGKQYIQRQIESIYDQTFHDFQLYIRDDGSDDKQFKELLKELQQKYGFVLIEGHNLGFVKSFMTLLGEVKDEIYYAFADQDDIWLPDKLRYAVEWMEQESSKYIREQYVIGTQVVGNIVEQVPLLYHSAYDIIDNEGKVTGHFYFPNEGYDFRLSITENHYSGFGMVINRKMREMMLKGQSDQIGYHDWWAAMIATGIGCGYFDGRVTALHRAHGKNVTTFNMGTRLRWLKNSLLSEHEIRKRVFEFNRCFGRQLTEGNCKILKLFCTDKYSLRLALKKCFYPKRWRPILSSELVIRFLMLIGKI